jgi:hypothetical protein
MSELRNSPLGKLKFRTRFPRQKFYLVRYSRILILYLFSLSPVIPLFLFNSFSHPLSPTFRYIYLFIKSYLPSQTIITLSNMSSLLYSLPCRPNSSFFVLRTRSLSSSPSYFLLHSPPFLQFTAGHLVQDTLT